RTFRGVVARRGGWRSISGGVCSGVTAVGGTPVPPLVSTTSGDSANACRSCAPNGSPSAAIVASGVRYPHSLRRSTRIGPATSAYTPAAARFDEINTRPVRRRSATSPIRSSSGLVPSTPIAALAAGLGDDLDIGDSGKLIDGLDHVDHGQTGDRHRGQGLH